MKPNTKPCSYKRCKQYAHAKGMCERHYGIKWRKSKKCICTYKKLLQKDYKPKEIKHAKVCPKNTK